jgi:hypothetical protein
MLVQALFGQSSASPVACKLHQQMHASWAHLAVPRMHLANTQAHLLLIAHFNATCAARQVRAVRNCQPVRWRGFMKGTRVGSRRDKCWSKREFRQIVI